MAAGSPTSATTTFGGTLGLGQTKEGLFICTLTDSTTGQQFTVSCYALITETS